MPAVHEATKERAPPPLIGGTCSPPQAAKGNIGGSNECSSHCSGRCSSGSSSGLGSWLVQRLLDPVATSRLGRFLRDKEGHGSWVTPEDGQQEQRAAQELPVQQ
jgi:hypothetical protein